MERISYKASAPGTLMLMGEHAVLENKAALVTATNTRIEVRCQLRTDKTIHLYSSLGELEIPLSELKIVKPFEYVLAAILSYQPQLTQGFDLWIEAAFGSTLGLGSSAAVTVATLAVLAQSLQAQTELNEATQWNIFNQARAVVQQVQGRASGADVAASVFGGILLYQAHPPFILKRLDNLVPLVVIYSGAKVPTPEVIQKVQAAFLEFPAVFESLYEATHQLVNEATQIIELKNWSTLGKLFNIQHGVMNALGVSTPHLNHLQHALNSDPRIWGAKISGSGLGDCVIGVGEAEAIDLGGVRLAVQCAREGLRYD